MRTGTWILQSRQLPEKLVELDAALTSEPKAPVGHVAIELFLHQHQLSGHEPGTNETPAVWPAPPRETAQGPFRGLRVLW